MARGKKTSEEKREAIKSVLFINPEASVRDIARQTSISHSTVQDIKKKCANELLTDDFIQYRTQKKQEYIDKGMKLLDNMLTVIERKINMLLENPEMISKVNLRDIATALGIIDDKVTRAAGEATIVIDRPEPIPELLSKYKTALKDFEKMIS